jgi:uncharacterized repeat protein (TIGR01451 family)
VKKRIIAKRVIAIITMLMLMMTFNSQVSLASAGAIWTTDKGGNVNVNQFEDRMSVFLNGGPTDDNGEDHLEDGDYYIRVTTPGGNKLLGNSNSTVKVENGKFPYSINLWDFLLKASDNTLGYDMTTNNGGEYQVWASLESDFKNSKKDNFFVLEPQISEPSIGLEKTADKSVAQVGDTITYSYVVTNTGNVELTNLTLSDDKLGNISLSKTTIAAGASVTGSATHKVVESDLPGPITNIATVTGKYGYVTVKDTDSEEVTLKTNLVPKISVDKTADKTTAKEGDEVTYTYTVSNMGDMVLTNVTLNDNKLGNITLSGTTLAVGASVTGSVKYIVKSGDFPGPLINIATAIGTYGEDKTVTATDSFEITLTQDQENNRVPGISVEKSADKAAAKLGDTITYTYIVTNTGQLDLLVVSLEDDKLGTIDLNTNSNEATSIALVVDESVTVTKTYTIKSGDLPLTNIATATGYYGEGDGDFVRDQDSVTISQGTINEDKKELPVTGGNPMPYLPIGTIVFGLGLVLRKRL